jgi:hypothetical protein
MPAGGVHRVSASSEPVEVVGEKENLMPCQLHGYQSSLSAADSRLHWLSQAASFTNELQSIATSLHTRMRNVSVRFTADRLDERIVSSEMARTWYTA